MTLEQMRAAKKSVELKKQQMRLTQKKSNINRKIKLLDKLAAGIEEEEAKVQVAEELVEETAPADIIFKPNPGPQTEFLAASEREVLFGGGAGGGKSYATIVDNLRYGNNPNHRAIIFRRTNDELRELIFKSQQLYPRVFPGAKWREKQSEWILPSGAIVWFTYLDRDEDVTRYQGQSFNHISFDELTQWPTPFAWDYMRTRLRSTDPSLPLFQRATANPGGVGGWWVKKMFIDPAPWGKPFPATDIETGEVLAYPKNHAKAGQPLFYRRFIPARLKDNPYLYEDGRYEANLMAIPETLRKQLLDGDWDVAADSAFPEFDKKIHVIEPFEIPDNWLKFRACDWGYSSPACVLWFAMDFDNNIYVYREYYGKGKHADAFARIILEMDGGDRISYGIMDGSAWSRRGEIGPAIPELMLREGLKWRPADRSPGSRRNGKMEIHRRLAIDEYTGEPRLKIFSNCVNLIRTLSIIPIDKNNVEDVDTKSEDHAYDALRYGLMSRPILPEWGDPSLKRSEWIIADPTFGY